MAPAGAIPTIGGRAMTATERERPWHRSPDGATVHRVQTPRQVELADALWDAEMSRVPIEPLTDQYDDLVVDDAYAIQAINVQRRLDGGARIVGRKVGLTSKPMQQVLGVDEPDYGVLVDDMYVEEGDEIDLSRLIQPRIEAELAFVLDRDLVGPGVTAPKALAAVAGVLPALEIVDSRIVDWRIRLVDTVACSSSGRD